MRRPDIWPRAWRRHPVTSLAIIALAVIVVWDRWAGPILPKPVSSYQPADVQSDYSRYHNKTFSCTRVVDGDTIDIDIPDGRDDTTRIRLWGVDTPETGKGGRARMYFGEEASAFVRSLVEGKPVRVVLVPDETRGKYGRLLAYVYLDHETMLNEELLVRGYAYADTRFPHPWKQRFVSLEDRACKAKVGLWAGVTPEQMPEWRQHLEQWRQEHPR